VSVRAEEMMLATGFIWPVLKEEVTDSRTNRIDPRTTSAQCSSGLWYSNLNGFGHKLCDNKLRGCDPRVNCYHPGEDWNACDNDESGKTVYAVANGRVVRTGSLDGNGKYLTMEHQLTVPERVKKYILAGTTVDEFATFGFVYSAYLHVDDILVSEGDIVVKGQPIARISSCCSHLHFELTRLPMTSASNCYCGYCTSEQQLTDVGYINPKDFIRDHVNDLTANPLDRRGAGRLEILGPVGAFGPNQGVVSAEVCPQDGAPCHSILTLLIDWESERIEISLGDIREPVVLEIRRAGGDLVGRLIYPFIDVTPLSWYAKVTTIAWRDGMVDGKRYGFFAPEANISRAEFVEMLAKVSGDTCSGDCPSAAPYSDVVPSDWFYQSVRLAFNRGWLTNSGTFRPHDSITRAEAAAILVRVTACVAVLHPVPDPYTDVTDVSSWFYEAIYEAREAELMSGYRKGFQCDGSPAEPGQRFFCPARAITRAEALQAIANSFLK
jgi:hypothetical protein